MLTGCRHRGEVRFTFINSYRYFLVLRIDVVLLFNKIKLLFFLIAKHAIARGHNQLLVELFRFRPDIVSLNGRR